MWGMAGICALLLGFAGAYLLVRGAFAQIEHGKRVAYASSSNDGNALVHWVMRNGVPVFRSLAKPLLSVGFVSVASRNAVAFVEGRGFRTDEQALLSIAVPILALVAMLVALVSGSVVCGFAASCIAVVVLVGKVSSWISSRQDSMREEVPDALRAMQACFASGFSLPQTIAHVGAEKDGLLQDLFRRASSVMETGGSTEDALSVFEAADAPDELAFVAAALEVQHLSGGSMGPVLDAARQTVEGELSLERSLRVQTAQARLSARIVTAMPFILIALFSFMSPDFLAPFFSSAMGMVVLACALTMQVAGVLLVRRMLAVGVD